MTITLKDIEQAREAVKEIIDKTELLYSRSCSDLVGTNVYLKLENQQKTGSFKIRGAANKILNLSDQEKEKGVVAASAGNHAQGVALAASLAGVKSYVVMPESTPIVKYTATKSYGAEVTLKGKIFDESYAHAKELEVEKGYTFVHPFNDPFIMAGQGTVGLEIIDQLKNVDSVVVPIGGGGLISGIATAIKSINPKCKIFGVVAEQAPGMRDLYFGDKSRKRASYSSIADGISVKTPSEAMFKDYIEKLVDGVTTVTEDEIAEAIVFLLERAKTVAEGSGAAALAGAMKAKWDLGENTVMLVSGGNIDLNLISKVIERGLSKKGRLARIYLAVNDTPGSLFKVTQILGELEANILDIYHDRLHPELEIRQTVLNILFETKGQDHLEQVLKALEKAGGKILSS